MTKMQQLKTPVKNQLYGMRAAAIALVVASHCSFLNQGGVGVSVMFVLSGFLAVRPFSAADIQFRSLWDVLKYYWKKLYNIYPSFFVILVGLKLLTENYYWTWHELFKILIFADGPGHFWFLQELVTMYLVTPVIVVLFRLCTCKITGTKRFLFLTVLSALLTEFALQVLAPRVVFRGNFNRPWYLYQYSLGMTFGYFYHYLKNSSFVRENRLSDRRWNIPLSLLTAVLFVLPVLTSDTVLSKWNPSYAGYYIGWAKPLPCGLLAGLFIILLSLDDDTLVSRLLQCKLPVTLGKFSYEIYIIHWYFLEFLQLSRHHYKNFILGYLVSAAVAAVIWQAVSRVKKRLSVITVSGV